jgi:hypothetical protein
MKYVVRSMVPALCILAAVACNRDRDRVGEGRAGVDPNFERDRSGTTTVTGANVGTVSNESAINRIVAARCAREAACNNLGTDKRFTSRDLCSQQLRSDMRDDLSAKDCPRGIDQKELDECLTEIQNENCNNPIDMIGRLAACRTSDLCLKTDTPNR